MHRSHRVLLVAVLIATCSCNGGTSSQSPEPDLHTEDGVQVDGAGEISFTDVTIPDGDSERVADVPADLEPVDVPPACEVGEGCFGDPCQDNDDCLSGLCVDHLGGTVCTDTCQEECPAGWSCKQAGTDPDVIWVCVSEHPTLCVPCATNTDCVGFNGAQTPCVVLGDEGTFCGGPCGEDVDCPSGYVCEDVESISGAVLNQCVPMTGVCDCTDRSVELGLSTPCSQATEFGTCEGFRVCTDEGLADCNAAAPGAELCNGLDDDCDGDVDEDTCDDGNFCTEDICHGEDGCEHVALDDIECPDGHLCTVGDICDQGVCVGSLTDCDDGEPCTDDSCDPETGDCVHSNNVLPCDDGAPCTVGDACLDGACVGIPIDCDCVADADCEALEDGDLCNGTLYCDLTSFPYLCKVTPDSVIECPDPDGPAAACLAPSCDPDSGACGFVGDNQGAPCDDLDPCSVGDACGEGECLAGEPANCNDGNPCTDDTCDPATGCVNTANTVPCEDGDVCTVGDHCQDGACVPGNGLACDDGNVCTDDACDSAVGCVHTPNIDGCDDGNLCTTGDHCAGGACVPEGTDACDDENPCTTDSCAPSLGCVHVHNTLPCNDGDVCTIGDVCSGGDCGGGALLPCDDGNLCTDDSCDPDSGCVFTFNTAPCDDGNVCTAEDHCASGWCAPGAPLVCDDQNPCTTDFCLPVDGCQAAPNTALCDDGSLCTSGDLCAAGQCMPGPVVDCDDGNLCTDDSCDPDSGCVHDANSVPCDDNNACTSDDVCASGTCQPGQSINCDDANPCTTDGCDVDTGCTHVDLEDQTSCGQDMVCVGGDCVDAEVHGDQTFSYTGGPQTFTVPDGVTSIDVVAYGAQGGAGAKGAPGKGGQITTDLAVTPGQTLHILVGGQGGAYANSAAGWNGGGTGANGACGPYGGGGGGGASDIRVGGTGLNDRVVVAGGGGGGGADGTNGGALFGGAGGGTIGGDGEEGAPFGGGCDPSGHGGTQSTGGARGQWACASCNSTDGSLGQGGNGNTSTGCGSICGGGGGGGGYYGGGGGGLGAGGGGSSHAGGGTSNTTHSQGIRDGDGAVMLSW